MPNKYIIAFFILVTGFIAHAQNEKWKEWEVEADTLLNRQDFDGAAKLYSKIIETAKPEYKTIFPVFYKRSVCYYSQNKMALALIDLNFFIPENPEDMQALLLRAFVYKEQGEVDLQLGDLNQIIRSRPANPDLLKWRASIFLDKEDYPSAHKDLLAVKAIQDDPETEMYLGIAQYGEGHADSALMSLNKAIALDITQLPPYLYAASYCLQEEQYELVLKYVNTALRLEPSNTTALFYKGIALVELKREKEGCRSLSKAFSLGEDDAAGYLKEYCYGAKD